MPMSVHAVKKHDNFVPLSPSELIKPVTCKLLPLSKSVHPVEVQPLISHLKSSLCAFYTALITSSLHLFIWWICLFTSPLIPSQAWSLRASYSYSVPFGLGVKHEDNCVIKRSHLAYGEWLGLISLPCVWVKKGKGWINYRTVHL